MKIRFYKLTDDCGETYYSFVQKINKEEMKNVKSFGYLLKMSKQDYEKYTTDEHYRHISKEEFNEIIKKYI